MIRSILRLFIPLIDLVLLLPLILAGIPMRLFRRIGTGRLPRSKAALLRLGIYPLQDHYYEPMFHPRHLRHSLEAERELPGIIWNDDGQLKWLQKINHSDELKGKWDTHTVPPNFFINNGSFESGDAEYWYGLVRHLKPSRIIEIGSGNSTIIARQAVARNMLEQTDYFCDHICIEPYEAPWLEGLGVRVLRERVEEVDPLLITSLKHNDILFIDSSHVIRPQGDVITELLYILPQLVSGVVVHIHDIFTPRDYSAAAIIRDISFWNEQYLLEAFLTQNPQWEIIGALNYLHHKYPSALRQTCPYLEKSREPGSFYIRKL